MLQQLSPPIALPSGGALHRDGAVGEPAMLLLHGVGGGAWSWKPQRSALASDARMYTWEARGHGSAARVADAGLADYYTDAREAIAYVVAETGGPVTVVGHSMGGLLAIVLAADQPESVRALGLIDPVYSTGEDAYGHFSPAVGRVARTMCSPLIRSFERNGAVSRALGRWVFAQAFEDRERMEAAWHDQQTQIPVEYPRMLRESFTGPTGFTLRDFAREIRVPTSLIEGSTAANRPRFPRLLTTLRERLGDALVYETIAGGHYLQLDRPDAVNGALRALLARV